MQHAHFPSHFCIAVLGRSPKRTSFWIQHFPWIMLIYESIGFPHSGIHLSNDDFDIARFLKGRKNYVVCPELVLEGFGRKRLIPSAALGCQVKPSHMSESQNVFVVQDGHGLRAARWTCICFDSTGTLSVVRMAFDEFVKLCTTIITWKVTFGNIHDHCCFARHESLENGMGAPAPGLHSGDSGYLRHVVIWSFVYDKYNIFVICKTEVNRNEGRKKGRKERGRNQATIFGYIYEEMKRRNRNGNTRKQGNKEAKNRGNGERRKWRNEWRKSKRKNNNRKAVRQERRNERMKEAAQRSK